MWKLYNGKKVESVTDFVRDNTTAGQEVHIGTDSLQVQKSTQFVTVLVILTQGKGGRVIYTREKVAKIDSLRERLLKEVWRSVELAMSLPAANLTIHIDANPLEKWASSKYIQELVGLVVGQGFRAMIKPDSWAATHAADHIVRHKSDCDRKKGSAKKVARVRNVAKKSDNR